MVPVQLAEIEIVFGVEKIFCTMPARAAKAGKNL
jgi:hypothetical protein